MPAEINAIEPDKGRPSGCRVDDPDTKNGMLKNGPGEGGLDGRSKSRLGGPVRKGVAAADCHTAVTADGFE